jgi:hypothetical protein
MSGTWEIFRTDFGDDGPVKTLYRIFNGPEENLRAAVASLNAMNIRNPKRPDLRDSSGELFHPPSKFEAIPLAS